MGLQFKINTITSDGAALIQRAKDNSDLVLIYKAVSIPDILGRNDAANFSASRFVTSDLTQYLPASNNVDAVSKAVAGDDVSFVSVQAKIANTVSAPCKSIVLLACLYSEREAPNPVAFAVISDDNSAIIADGVAASITLNVPTKYIKLFGADSTQAQIDDIVSNLQVISGDISDIQDDISDLQTFNIDETGTPETGIHYTLKKDDYEDVEIPRESVVLSCELIDGALVFTTGNGDIFSISGENVTIEKSTLYPPTEIEVLFGVNWDSVNSEWAAKDLNPGYNYGKSGILSEASKELLESFGLVSIELNSDGAPYGYAATEDNTAYTVEILKVYSDLGETEIPIDTFSANIGYNTTIDGATYYMPGIQNSNSGTNVKSWLCKISKVQE